MSGTSGIEPAYEPTADILDSLEEGVCVLNNDLRVVRVNASLERICNRPHTQIIGSLLGEINPAFANAELSRALENSLRDGHRRRVELEARSEVDIYAQPTGLWLILRDPGSRKAMEQQLRDRDEILRLAEQSAGIGVWDIDLASQMVRGTPQFWRIIGLPPTKEAVPLETTRDRRLPEDRERVAKGFSAVVSNHAESFEMEYRIRRPDGQIRWIFGFRSENTDPTLSASRIRTAMLSPSARHRATGSLKRGGNSGKQGATDR